LSTYPQKVIKTIHKPADLSTANMENTDRKTVFSHQFPEGIIDTNSIRDYTT